MGSCRVRIFVTDVDKNALANVMLCVMLKKEGCIYYEDYFIGSQSGDFELSNIKWEEDFDTMLLSFRHDDYLEETLFFSKHRLFDAFTIQVYLRKNKKQFVKTLSFYEYMRQSLCNIYYEPLDEENIILSFYFLFYDTIKKWNLKTCDWKENVAKKFIKNNSNYFYYYDAIDFILKKIITNVTLQINESPHDIFHMESEEMNHCLNLKLQKLSNGVLTLVKYTGSAYMNVTAKNQLLSIWIDTICKIYPKYFDGNEKNNCFQQIREFLCLPKQCNQFQLFQIMYQLYLECKQIDALGGLL